jgi:predicted ABC-type transport system involved in lysophospholipase L1 biosynthesis ATPase subunit
MTERDVLVRADALERVHGSGRDAVAAILGASFTISARDRLAIVGPSGSGKSTLLHLIAGLDTPTSGSIAWPALGRREQLRPGPVALAFQGPSLLPPLSVVENVALPVLLGGGSEAEAMEIAREMLGRFELTEIADKLPEEISGGQSQRAGLARALAGSPILVLADEPTGQQDRATGMHVLDTLLDLISASGAALVVATHDLAVADQLPIRWTVAGGRLASEVAPCSA